MNSYVDCRALLLLGPTGAGKTPLGEWLEEHGLGGLRCHHFDFGSRLRAIAAGRESASFTVSEVEFVRDVLEKGALLENEQFYLAAKILQSFISSRVKNPLNVVVLNGLPRHAGQAESMQTLVKVSAVVSLECSAEVVMERIRHNSGGDRTERTDDATELVRRKLAVFAERTQLLIEYYRDGGVPIVPVQVGIHTQPADVANMINI